MEKFGVKTYLVSLKQLRQSEMLKNDLFQKSIEASIPAAGKVLLSSEVR